jgi:transposase-like protein
VIHLNDQRYWLYAAVDPETNEFLHVRLFPTRMIVLTKRFLRELREKSAVDDSLFLSRQSRTVVASCTLRTQPPIHHVTRGNRNAAERVFKEVKRRTEQFVNHFRHASAYFGETWL